MGQGAGGIRAGPWNRTGYGKGRVPGLNPDSRESFFFKVLTFNFNMETSLLYQKHIFTRFIYIFPYTPFNLFVPLLVSQWILIRSIVTEHFYIWIRGLISELHEYSTLSFSLHISKFSMKFFGYISTNRMLNVIVYCMYSIYKYEKKFHNQSLAFTINLLT